MDHKLSQLIEELTTSGESQLNAQKMKELKKICKSSEEQLSHAYHLLKTQLTQDHAEIRLSAFQIVDELFTRSHQFRVLLVSDFQEFLELTLGTDNEHPLPPPREAAQRLKQAAMQAVEGWNEKFGEAYKKLALGYHFLKHIKKVDFRDVNVRSLAERKREEEKQKHLDKIHRESAERAKREMEEMSDEIGYSLTEVENCFKLLVPLDFGPYPEDKFFGEASGITEGHVPYVLSPDLATSRESGLPLSQNEEQPCCSKDLVDSADHVGSVVGLKALALTATQDPSRDEDEHSDPEEFLRSHGLGSHKYTLDVELPSDGLKVQENEDNLAVLHAARDSLKLIQNKFLPTVCSWVQRFTRAGIYSEHLKQAIDLKMKLQLALKKCEELNIKPEREPRSRTEALEDSEDEDQDFVEVPEKEGYEPRIPDHLRAEYGLEPGAPLKTLEKGTAVCSLQERTRMRKEEEASDPTSAAAQLLRLQECLPSTSSSSPGVPLEPEEAQKQAERARAPIVPFGVDLCYWGQEKQTAGKILKSDSQHRFWKPSEVEEEVDSAHVSEMLHSRHITFAGKFEPVQHQCRALKPNGRLCERQDRLKCPFHGKIIPRDDKGQPLNPEDRAREQRQRFQQQQAHPGWQDPEFMKDVEAATGVDLGSSKYSKKGKGKKKKHPNLTDLRERANTSRARLEKKVFAKAAVQRVVAAMNQMDQKKHEKFANQFNYALN
uniref:UV-stimulated scaffold protein A n=1 Tax=Myodes glareolus TaxID=447135 RepID=UPI002020A797|nr:UV-stimulated scaffold protein A [Myodes glareolus]XP_048270853.1 UV-stimulated scaffold protein A [Myodes glareolus]XP_048270854.1 UV-stimulated scaffold protein A [Myodes glareolus]XP_048270855.1 UV-stimulated scaffold protein A [Myodes glareolus]XP_048270856.1 UV-stimulated scaffold protein A [Myodes glareolus]